MYYKAKPEIPPYCSGELNDNFGIKERCYYCPKMQERVREMYRKIGKWDR